jgi:hypothetical protein
MSPRMLAIGLLCWSGAALAEDLVVIESEGAPSLAVGAMLADGKSVELPAGAQVVMVGATGKTVSLAGPYKGVPSSGSASGDGKLMMALASLVRPKEEETSKIGAVRSIPWRTNLVKAEADVMALDVDLKGTQCVTEADPKQIVLVVNPKKQRTETVTLMSVESGAAQELKWPKSDMSMKWPANLPFEDGNTYLFDIPQPTSLVQFTVKVLPKSAANKVERAAQLMEAGCTDQAKLMVELIKQAAR